jgi:hypothetical protein
MLFLTAVYNVTLPMFDIFDKNKKNESSYDLLVDNLLILLQTHTPARLHRL